VSQSPPRLTKRTMAQSLALLQISGAVLTVTLSLLAVLGTGVLLLRDYATDNLTLVARQAAYASEVALVFNDAGAAAQAVQPIVAEAHVDAIIIRRADGSEFARIADGPAGMSQAAWYSIDPPMVSVPINSGGSAIGSISASGRTMGIGLLLTGSLIGACIALAALLLLMRLVRQRLYETAIEPLERMAQIAHDVRHSRRFDQRVPRAGTAEIDSLGRDFNALLDELTNWQAQVETAHDALLHRATHDPLSGLPNRTCFIDRADDAIRQAKRTGSSIAILYMDGDNFKQTNDQHGHEAGDRVIRAIAGRITPLLRVGDFAARLGGDEFAALIRHLENEADVAAVAARIEAAMAVPIQVAPGQDELVSLSIGHAIYPRDGEDVEALMRAADARMYAIKSSRRDDGQYDQPKEQSTI
jgi:diguanylate cyclase (GGDEF)-like protein